MQDAAGVANYVTVVAVNTAQALASWGRVVGREVEAADVEPLTWALAERGRQVSAPDYVGIVEYVHAFGRRMASWWQDGFDLLLTPTQAAPPPSIGHVNSSVDEPVRGFVRAAPYGVFTMLFNLTGQPAISLPGHWSDEGLPVGAQLVAASGHDDLLLRVAAQVEESAPWSDRLPPIFG